MLPSEIVIDEDFAALMPPLDEEAFETLRANVVKAGKILDPLIVWKGHGILVDGHNRLRVYNEESAKVMVDLPRIEEVEFADRGAVLEWMYLHQRGRRNWTANQMSVLRAKVYKAAKQRPETQARDPETACFSKNEPYTHSADTAPIEEPKSKKERTTAAAVGAEIGAVSADTVLRDVTYDDAIESIKTVNGKAAADLVSGTLKLTKKETIALANSGDIASGLKNLRAGRKWTDDGKSAPEPADETPEPQPVPGVDSAVYKRVISLEKSYNALGGSVEWLKHHASKESSKAALAEIESSLTVVYRNIQKLKKQVSK